MNGIVEKLNKCCTTKCIHVNQVTKLCTMWLWPHKNKPSLTWPYFHCWIQLSNLPSIFVLFLRYKTMLSLFLNHSFTSCFFSILMLYTQNKRLLWFWLLASHVQDSYFLLLWKQKSYQVLSGSYFSSLERRFAQFPWFQNIGQFS